MFDPNLASIIIAIIGGAFGVWAAHVSNKNQKATRDITDVLNNTKTPVDSLDQVVRLLQEELNRSNKRHDEERDFFNQEIQRLRAENQHDRKVWAESEFKMQAELDKLIAERVNLLEQIRDLKNQLADLEFKVRSSLDNMEQAKSGTK